MQKSNKRKKAIEAELCLSQILAFQQSVLALHQIKGILMEDLVDRYGSHFVKLVDSRAIGRILSSIRCCRGRLPSVIAGASIEKEQGGCRLALNKDNHHLPKCIKIPRDIAAILNCLKRYIATGIATSCLDAASMHEAMSLKVDPGSDFSPATSC